MSNPEQQQDDNGRRKSKRQRVPNPYYTAGINQLKKVTLKGASKKNRTDEEGEQSSDEDRNMSNNNRINGESYHNLSKGQVSLGWLSCILPTTNKHLKVQIVIDSTLQPAQTEQLKYKDEYPARQQSSLGESQPVSIPSYISAHLPKKVEAQGGLNLLSLFEKVIKNVADEAPSPLKPSNVSQITYHHHNNLEEPVLKYQTSTQKTAKPPVLTPPPKRVIEEDKDGKILSLTVDRENKTLRINHSKIGQCEVPIEVEPLYWKIQEEKTQQQIETVEQIKKKLAFNTRLLASIAIYN